MSGGMGGGYGGGYGSGMGRGWTPPRQSQPFNSQGRQLPSMSQPFSQQAQVGQMPNRSPMDFLGQFMGWGSQQPLTRPRTDFYPALPQRPQTGGADSFPALPTSQGLPQTGGSFMVRPMMSTPSFEGPKAWTPPNPTQPQQPPVQPPPVQPPPVQPPVQPPPVQPPVQPTRPPIPPKPTTPMQLGQVGWMLDGGFSGGPQSWKPRFSPEATQWMQRNMMGAQRTRPDGSTYMDMGVRAPWANELDPNNMLGSMSLFTGNRFGG